MTENFTLNKFLTKAIMSFALTFIAFGTYAQVVNTLTVTSPASIAGDYQFAIAGFGQQLTSPLSGIGGLIDDGTDPVNDGCEPGASNIVGKIAFIDRGDCQFGTKALNAENAGCIAVVICNNNDDPIFQMVPGDDGPNVNVPTGMVSMADCNTIKVMLEMDDIEATIQNLCAPPVYGPEVIWGRNAGEGDFANGFDGWVVEDDPSLEVSTWHYDINADATGLFTAYQIQSPTACNGAAVMSSDSLDNGGTTIGAGPCPNPCISELVSPTIDVSSADPEKGFFIQFAQAFRQFTSEYQIVVSKNGGATYPDTIFLNQDAVVNSPNIDEIVKIPLLGYEGTQSIKFKFRYVGNYYYWIIDDVAITNESYVDMQLNNNWYAAPPSWRVPASQVSEMPFLVDMFNNGNLVAENVEVDINIFDESGTQVYDQTMAYGDVGAYTLRENQVLTGGTWVAPSEPGIYTGSYAVRAETSTDFTNNLLNTNDSITFQLEVTENVFSNIPGELDGNGMNGMTDGSIFSDNGNSASPAYASGAVFYTPNGAGHKVGNITFGVSDEQTVASGFVHARLYQWVGDLDNSSLMEPTERALVGVNTVIVDTSSNKRNIEIPMFAASPAGDPIPGEDVDLVDNGQYMLVLLAEPLSPTVQLDVISASNSNGFNRNYNHFASNMAFDSLFIDRNPGTYFEVMTAGTPAEFESIAIDFYDINELWAEIVVYPVGTGAEDINSNIELKAYPNPTGDMLNVNVALTNPSDITLEILDLSGKLVQTDKFQNVKTGTIVLTTEQLSNGVYLLNVRSDEGIRTEKIMIQR